MGSSVHGMQSIEEGIWFEHTGPRMLLLYKMAERPPALLLGGGAAAAVNDDGSAPAAPAASGAAGGPPESALFEQLRQPDRCVSFLADEGVSEPRVEGADRTAERRQERAKRSSQPAAADEANGLVIEREGGRIAGAEPALGGGSHGGIAH